MKYYFISILMLLNLWSCKAQEDGELEKEQAKVETRDSTTPQPKVSWKVNKETDEYGNVIRYDSIYSWSYSNKDGNKVMIDADSLMNSFSGFMTDRMPEMFTWDPWSPFERDSLWRDNFWKPDFFRNRWKNDFRQMDSIMQRMDSIRNRYLKERYPNWEKDQEKQKI